MNVNTSELTQEPSPLFDYSQPYPRFSLAEYAARWKAVRGIMKQQGTDCLVIWGLANGVGEPAGAMDLANIFYLTGYLDPWFCYLVFPAEGAPSLFVSPLANTDEVRFWSVVDDIRPTGTEAGKSIATWLADRGFGRSCIGTVGGTRDQGQMPLEHFQAMQSALPGATFKNCTTTIEEIRCVKSPAELDLMRRGCQLSDLALEAVVGAARSGMSDAELRGVMLAAPMGAGGQWHLDFLGSTSMRRPDMPFPRIHKSNRILRPGDVLLNEVSVGLWGYSGQIQRPFTVGTPPTRRYRYLWDLAVHMLGSLESELCAGATEEAVWRTYAEFERHGCTHYGPLVHGWGLNLEVPLFGHGARRGDPFVFRENMTVMIQPNPAIPGTGAGVFLGHLVRITPTGIERMHRFPVEFMQVG